MAFLNIFAAHLTMFDIHRDYWVPELISLLDEKFISYLTDLLKEDKTDFHTLCQTLMEYHSASTEYYR